MPIPVLFFPAFVNYFMEYAHIWPKNAKLAKIVELILCATSLTLALPLTVAIFEQRSKIDREKLEPEF